MVLVLREEAQRIWPRASHAGAIFLSNARARPVNHFSLRSLLKRLAQPPGRVDRPAPPTPDRALAQPVQARLRAEQARRACVAARRGGGSDAGSVHLPPRSSRWGPPGLITIPSARNSSLRGRSRGFMTFYHASSVHESGGNRCGKDEQKNRSTTAPNAKTAAPTCLRQKRSYASEIPWPVVSQ